MLTQLFHDWVLRRLYKFLLKPLLSKVLKTDLDLDNLDVQLASGTLELSQLLLDEVYLSRQLGDCGWAVKAGYVGKAAVVIPYQNLLTEQIRVKATDVMLTVRQHVPGGDDDAGGDGAPGDGAGSGAGSGGEEEGEEVEGEEGEEMPGSILNGVETIAQSIRLALSNLRVEAESISVRVEFLEAGGHIPPPLMAQLDSVTYSTSLSPEDPEDLGRSAEVEPVKTLEFENLSLLVLEDGPDDAHVRFSRLPEEAGEGGEGGEGGVPSPTGSQASTSQPGFPLLDGTGGLRGSLRVENSAQGVLYSAEVSHVAVFLDNARVTALAGMVDAVQGVAERLRERAPSSDRPGLGNLAQSLAHAPYRSVHASANVMAAELLPTLLQKGDDSEEAPPEAVDLAESVEEFFDSHSQLLVSKYASSMFGWASSALSALQSGMEASEGDVKGDVEEEATLVSLQCVCRGIEVALLPTQSSWDADSPPAHLALRLAGPSVGVRSSYVSGQLNEQQMELFLSEIAVVERGAVARSSLAGEAEALFRALPAMPRGKQHLGAFRAGRSNQENVALCCSGGEKRPAFALTYEKTSGGEESGTQILLEMAPTCFIADIGWLDSVASRYGGLLSLRTPGRGEGSPGPDEGKVKLTVSLQHVRLVAFGYPERGGAGRRVAAVLDAGRSAQGDQVACLAATLDLRRQLDCKITVGQLAGYAGVFGEGGSSCHCLATTQAGLSTIEVKACGPASQGFWPTAQDYISSRAAVGVDTLEAAALQEKATSAASVCVGVSIPGLHAKVDLPLVKALLDGFSSPEARGAGADARAGAGPAGMARLLLNVSGVLELGKGGGSGSGFRQSHRLAFSEARFCIAWSAHREARLTFFQLCLESCKLSLPGTEGSTGPQCCFAIHAQDSAAGGLILSTVLGGPGTAALLNLNDATAWTTDGDLGFGWATALGDLIKSELALPGTAEDAETSMNIAIQNSNLVYRSTEPRHPYSLILALEGATVALGRTLTLRLTDPAIYVGNTSILSQPGMVDLAAATGTGAVTHQDMEKDQYVAVLRDSSLELVSSPGTDEGGQGEVALRFEELCIALHSDTAAAVVHLRTQIAGDEAKADDAESDLDTWEMVDEDGGISEESGSSMGEYKMVENLPSLQEELACYAFADAVRVDLQRATVGLISGTAWASAGQKILTTTEDGEFEEDEWEGETSISQGDIEMLLDVNLQGCQCAYRTCAEVSGDLRNIGVSVREIQIHQCDLKKVGFWNGSMYQHNPFPTLAKVRAEDKSWKRIVWNWQTLRAPRSAESMLECAVLVSKDAVSGADVFKLSHKMLPLRVYLTQKVVLFLVSFTAGLLPPGPATKPKGVNTVRSVVIGGLDLRIDYKPHRVSIGRGLKNGNLHMELLNLVPLHGVELSLPPLGFVDLEDFKAVSDCVLGAWLHHIAAKEAGKFVTGIRPIKSLSKVGVGASKLVTLPLAEYKQQGDVVRGVKQGVTEFLHAVSLEVLQLSANIAGGAETVLKPEIGTLPTSSQERAPANVREGLSQAANQLSWGLQAAAAVVSGHISSARQTDQDVKSSILSALKMIPTAVAVPAGAAAGAVKVTLQGVRNQYDAERYLDRLDDEQ